MQQALPSWRTALQSTVLIRSFIPHWEQSSKASLLPGSQRCPGVVWKRSMDVNVSRDSIPVVVREEGNRSRLLISNPQQPQITRQAAAQLNTTQFLYFDRSRKDGTERDPRSPVYLCQVGVVSAQSQSATGTKLSDSLIPYTTSSNDIEDFLGAPTWEEVVGQRLPHFSTMHVGSVIKRRI